MDCLITHSTLVQCMIRCCAAAMKGRGRVVIGDCPLQGCDFPALMRHSGMQEIVAAANRDYPDLRLDVEDWRLTVLHRASGFRLNPVYTDQTLRDGDVAVSEHYTVLDAATESYLEEISDYADRFRVTMYQPSLLQANHRPGVHKYLVRNDALDADLFLNLAKMKTHEKAGLTAAMKNLVGVNGHKEYLPHHLRGPYFAGGDCYGNDNWFAAGRGGLRPALGNLREFDRSAKVAAEKNVSTVEGLGPPERRGPHDAGRLERLRDDMAHDARFEPSRLFRAALGQEDSQRRRRRHCGRGRGTIAADSQAGRANCCR